MGDFNKALEGMHRRQKERDEQIRQDEKIRNYARAYGSTGQLGRDYGFVPMKKQVETRNIIDFDYDHATAMAMALYASALPKLDKTQPNAQIFSPELIRKMRERKEELIKQNEDKMKTKRFYHTFEFENREVTLCLLVEEERHTFVERIQGVEPSATIKVGYAVCVPEDRFSEKLAKRISSGRAESEKARLHKLTARSTVEFAFDLGILNATARIYERRIKRGQIVIKGIRPIKKEQ